MRTVSNVVRGTGHFSEETREKVARAVEEPGTSCGRRQLTAARSSPRRQTAPPRRSWRSRWGGRTRWWTAPS
ncbi:MAG TPA: LacI family DNA-binding transcriptional regulator [Streptomyces sp.]